MKPRTSYRGLLRLGEGPEAGPQAREARTLARLETAWPLLVGQALAPHTRPLRVHHRTLVLGCHRNEMIPSLRATVVTVWPVLQERLERMLGLRLVQIEVVPCDPPPPPMERPRRSERDPLKAVLDKLRSLQRSHPTTSDRRTEPNAPKGSDPSS